MKEIKLTRGQIALVDDDDFETLNKYKWYAKERKTINGIYYYALRRFTIGFNKSKLIRMHRFITNTLNSNLDIDYISGTFK